MTAALANTAGRRFSAADFRAFQAGRPDHERWELIAGVPVMMTPPTIRHNRIASTLERLLNDALEVHAPTLVACQRPGLEIDFPHDVRPEPDVAVIDADFAPEQRYATRVWLVTEIVSASDLPPVPGFGESWIAVKRRLYRTHEPCRAVLLVEQDRPRVTLDLRDADGWRTLDLVGPDARLAIPEFGFDHALAELYRGIPFGA
jgi:Uma2 family endonuclease